MKSFYVWCGLWSRGCLILLSFVVQSMLAIESEYLPSAFIVIEDSIDLAARLPKTDVQPVTEGVLEFKSRAFTKIEQCDYMNALVIILEGLAHYPKNFGLQAFLAALIGDTSELYSGILQERMLASSRALFTKLLEEVTAQSKLDTYQFRNEYFFRFGMHQEQYESGLQMVTEYWGTSEWISNKGAKGYYYQGVGATYYAKQLWLRGEKRSALDMAQKGIIAWAQYFSYDNNYYNAYVHYALVLGMLGYRQEMLRALERSAGLVNRDLLYHEFKEVIDFIDSLETCV